MYYSKSTGGFYDREIHGDNIPEDAVEITNQEHAALLDGQSNGKIITADENGYPVLTDPPKPQPKEITTVTMRQARLALLKKGLLNEVEAMPKTPEQQIWWEYSTTVEKYNSITQEIAAALELNLTELFEFAATL